MSDPFRSEVEPLREKLRRAEERINELTEEKAKLERINGGRDPSNRVLVMTVSFCMMIVALVACVLFVASSRTTARNEEVKTSLSREVEEERMKGESCRGDLSRERAALTGCMAALGGEHASADPAEPSPPNAAPFNRAAAAEALSSVHRALEACLVPARPLGIHATVTFAPTGSPAVAMLDQLGDESKLTPTEKSCITKELFHVKVPPFASNRTVAVGKTYTFTSPPAPR